MIFVVVWVLLAGWNLAQVEYHDALLNAYIAWLLWRLEQ